MKKSYVFFLVVLGFILTLGIWEGCHNEKVSRIEIVARVGDHYLTRDQLLKWMPPDLPEDQFDFVARQYVDRWVRTTTLYLAALESGVNLSPYEEWSIDHLKENMLAQKYLQSKLPHQIVITDKEIEDYYQQHREEFKRDEDEVHLVHLFLENRDPAIAREIQESKSLLDVIEHNYLDRKLTRLNEPNGDLGYVPISKIRREILRRVKIGKTGRIYGPISLEGGNYYFQMLDKQPAGSYRSLELVKDQIRMQLLNVRRRQLEREIAEQTAKNFKVEVFMEHLK